MQICHNCGNKNADIQSFCHRCGAALGRPSETQSTAMRAGIGPERLLWNEGDVQLTTEALLIGMESDSPDVIPLETIHQVSVDGDCLVVQVKYGDDKHCFLKNPTELARLVEEQVMRPRLADQRDRARPQPGEAAEDAGSEA
jgi:hypothetical protein